MVFGENATVGGQIPTIWLEKEFHTTNGTQELASLFPEQSKVFDYPKPVQLIEDAIHAVSNRNALILDSFAGSGTTGHAVLNLNESDGGSRKFILIELSDYADSLTAERERRVIGGYTALREVKSRLFEKKLTNRNIRNASAIFGEAESAKEAAESDGTFYSLEGPKFEGNAIVVDGITRKGDVVPGIDAGFSYYELGPALFRADGSLDPGVTREQLNRYVWATECRKPYADRTDEHPYLLGEHAQAVYYLAWEPDQETVLSYDLLRGLPRKGSPTVIYADRCTIAPERLEAMGIVFKQVPRQIARI